MVDTQDASAASGNRRLRGLLIGIAVLGVSAGVALSLSGTSPEANPTTVARSGPTKGTSPKPAAASIPEPDKPQPVESPQAVDPSPVLDHEGTAVHAVSQLASSQAQWQGQLLEPKPATNHEAVPREEMRDPAEEQASESSALAEEAEPAGDSVAEEEESTEQAEVADEREPVGDSVAEETRPAPAAGSLVAHFRDASGPAYSLLRVTAYLDGMPLGSPQGKIGSSPVKLIDRNVPMGPHTVAFIAEYQGNGFGVLSYMEGYRFTARSVQKVTAGPRSPAGITFTVYQKGGALTPFNERLGIHVRYN